MRFWIRFSILGALALLAACGPNIGSLQKGEKGNVTRVVNGDTLELDSGLRVFLAEIDAPRRDEPYAQQSEQELEALALHRPVILAYGGTHRWEPRRRDVQDETTTGTSTGTGTGAGTATNTATSTAVDPQDDQPTSETAIAHVFVQSEGGRWIWLNQQMVAQGAAYVRPRHDNHARATELLAAEAQARAAHRGLWTLHEYAIMSPRKAAEAATAANTSCRRGQFSFVEGTITHADVQDRRASLDMEGAPFSIAVFGQGFSNWDGTPLASLAGKRVRVRGQIGMFHDAAQICVDNSGEIEVLSATTSH